MNFLMKLFNDRYGYTKKKMLSMALVFSLVLLCVGCGKRQEDVKQVEDVKQQDDVKLEDIEEETEEDTDEKKDKLAGYEKITERERFGAEVSYEIIGYVKQEEAPEPYCNTNGDGSFLTLMWLSGGTPYDVAGAIYDHDMFTMQTYIESKPADSNYEGGGETTYLYQFTPTHPGDAEIVMLYIHNDIYEGTIYNITVEDDLRCRWNWDGRVTQDENLDVFED